MNNEEQEFDLSFTDITILETEGYYEETKKLMEEDTFFDCPWAISSDLTMSHISGPAEFSLDFHCDKKIIIISYEPSIGDVYYNPDISCLSMWAQDRGWEIPEPIPALVKNDLYFWKHFWEISIIQSNYLDNKYGKRE